MPLWYIPMIFVLLLMAFWIFRSKDDLKWNITVFLSSALVAFILCEEIKLPNLPFGLETAIYMFPFFALGKVIGSVKDEFTRKSILGTLSLGTHRLRFLMAPMVHWPEVMTAYEETERILFSADAFGRFGALERTARAPLTNKKVFSYKEYNIEDE